MKRTEPTSHLYHGHRYVPSHQTNVMETWRQARERIATTPKLPAPQRGNADIALLVFAVVCVVWLVIAGAMGWLPGGGL